MDLESTKMRNTFKKLSDTLPFTAIRGYSAKKSAELMALAIVTTAIQVICFMLLFQKLGVESFGKYRTFLSLSAFSGMFHLGFADGIFLKWLIDKHQPKSEELYTTIIITLITSFAAFFFKLPIQEVMLLFVYFLLANVSYFFHSVCVQAGVFRTSLLYNIWIQLSLLSLLLVVGPTIGLLPVLVAGAVAQLIAVILLWKYTSMMKMVRTSVTTKVQMTDVGYAIRQGIPVLMAGVFFLAIFNLDKVLLAGKFLPVDFGFYAFATSIVSIGLGVLSAPVNLVLSRMAHLDFKSLANIYHRLFAGVWAIGFLAVPLVWIAFTVLHQFSEHYDGAKPYALLWALLLFPVMAMQVLLSNLYKRLKYQAAFLGVAVIALCIMFGIIYYSTLNTAGLRFVPVSIAQLLLTCMVVLEKILLSHFPEFKKGHYWRLIMILLFSIFIWIFYAW